MQASTSAGAAVNPGRARSSSGCEQKRNLLAALAQRGNGDLGPTDAKVKVLSEAPFGHGASQVARRRAHPHLHAPGSRRAQRDDPLGLDGPEELRLHGCVEIRHLVEEERSAVGGLDVAVRVLRGARIRAAPGAEEQPLGEALRDSGAVDGNEGPTRAGASMKRARCEVLAGPALAGQEEHVPRARGPLNLSPRAEQRRSDERVAVAFDRSADEAADVALQQVESRPARKTRARSKVASPVTRRPSTYVPLWLSRSAMSQPPPLHATRTCRLRALIEFERHPRERPPANLEARRRQKRSSPARGALDQASTEPRAPAARAC